MGDKNRFKVFSNEIENKFNVNKYRSIADIAGGKGYLNHQLSIKGYNVVTFDKRNNNRNGVTFKKRYFDGSIKEKFDLLVGMHPDEATDVIIYEAYKRRIPFAIVPCCIMPTSSKFDGPAYYQNWIHHLDMFARKLGFNVFKKQINITGKNIMIWGLI